MSHFKLLDLGLKPYQEVLQLQEKLFEENIEAKLQNKPTQNYLILCEHNPVFTLGKSGKRANILVSDEDMHAEFYHVYRGGDVTFHGPGQLVAYPILDLDTLQISLSQDIYQLEEIIIESLKNYGLQAQRLEGAAGIWLGDADNSILNRKICAIGVKASRNITMHGLAINIHTDLSYFDKIVACGLPNKSTTSLQKELNFPVQMCDYKAILINEFSLNFALYAFEKDLK